MFEKGDYVKVKSLKDINKNSNTTWWNPKMERFCGNVYVVRDVFRTSEEYILEGCLEPGEGINNIEDSDYWLFDKQWVEEAEQEPLDLSEEDFMKMF